MTTVTDRLADEVAELRGLVEGLRHEAEVAREQAREVLRGPMYGAGVANARERAAHEAWKRSRGYGAPAPPQLTVAQQTEAYQRQVAQAAKAEAEQKAAWEKQNRENAARRAALGVEEPDEFQRAQSSALRQRQIEAERRMRDEPNPYAVKDPIVVDATVPAGGLS